jgi:hypothetical protein
MVVDGETLGKYLQNAALEIGIGLSVNKNGLFVLRDGNCGVEHMVELPSGSDILYCYAPICKPPYGCEEEFFEKVLELNLCTLEYNQATLGLDSKTKNIVMSYTYPTANIDEIVIANILRNFVKTVKRARNDFVAIAEELIGKSVLSEDDIDSEIGSIDETRTLGNNPIKLKA